MKMKYPNKKRQAKQEVIPSNTTEIPVWINIPRRLLPHPHPHILAGNLFLPLSAFLLFLFSCCLSIRASYESTMVLGTNWGSEQARKTCVRWLSRVASTFRDAALIDGQAVGLVWFDLVNFSPSKPSSSLAFSFFFSLLLSFFSFLSIYCVGMIPPKVHHSLGIWELTLIFLLR